MAKTLCQSFKYKKTTYYKIIQNKGKVTEKYKIDPKTNKRSMIRFKQEVEKVKKNLHLKII